MRGQLRGFAYDSPTFRVGFAYFSRSKGNGRGGRKVGVMVGEIGRVSTSGLEMDWT